MKLYLDSSALVKRYVDEEGSEAVLDAMDRADGYSMCRIGFVETVSAVARRGEPEDVERLEGDWGGIDVIEVDKRLSEHAARLAVDRGLRTLDALHLAAALSIASWQSMFATWDARLHRAARECGLRTLPVALESA